MMTDAALAFTPLWNHTLRTLTAVESSVVNNTMTIQITVLQLAPFIRRRSATAS